MSGVGSEGVAGWRLPRWVIEPRRSTATYRVFVEFFRKTAGQHSEAPNAACQ